MKPPLMIDDPMNRLKKNRWHLGGIAVDETKILVNGTRVRDLLNTGLEGDVNQFHNIQLMIPGKVMLLVMQTQMETVEEE